MPSYSKIQFKCLDQVGFIFLFLFFFHMQIFAVLIPIVGLGAFLWWAGRDIMQGTVSHLQILTLKLPAFLTRYLCEILQI